MSRQGQWGVGTQQSINRSIDLRRIQAEKSGILIDKTLVEEAARQAAAIVRLDGFEVSNADFGPSGDSRQIQPLFQPGTL
jgi:hypothetical protein